MTSRFDYQPDICKDYKDTGFCGYGDTCIYLHDRGDTLSGWQLEEQWQEQQKLKQQQQQAEMEAFADGNVISNNNKTKKEGSAVVLTEDGLPFACHICRQPFTDPIVTSCGHYFCEACIVEQMRSSLSSDSTHCPICRKDTHGVLNQPTKLLAKKRRLVGANASWKEFADACAAKKA
jgi:RING finger protein 113A